MMAVFGGCRRGSTAPSLKWISGFSGTKWDGFSAVTSDGSHLVAVGFTESSDGDMTDLYQHGQSDALLVRMNDKGEKIAATSFGGSSHETFQGVVSVNGRIFAAGSTKSSDGDLQVITPMGGNDALLVSFDREGTPGWVANFGGQGEDAFQSIAEAKDGGLIAAGRTNSSDGHLASVEAKGNYDALLVKYNTQGTALWAATFGGSGWDEFTHVQSARDGGIIAVGFTHSPDGDLAARRAGRTDRDALMVKFNEKGGVEWYQIFSGSESDEFAQVAVMKDGYAAVGTSQSADGAMSGYAAAKEDAVVVRYNLLGEKLWTCPLGGTQNEQGTAIVYDQSRLLVSGYTGSNDLAFQDVKSQGGYDAFLYCLDSEGEPLWHTELGSGGWDQVSSLLPWKGGWILSGYSDGADGDLEGLKKLGNYEGFVTQFS